MKEELPWSESTNWEPWQVRARARLLEPAESQALVDRLAMEMCNEAESIVGQLKEAELRGIRLRHLEGVLHAMVVIIEGLEAMGLTEKPKEAGR
mgnify:FL=1